VCRLLNALINCLKIVSSIWINGVYYLILCPSVALSVIAVRAGNLYRIFLYNTKKHSSMCNGCKIIRKVRRSITSEIVRRLCFSYGTCERIIKHVFNMRMVSRSSYRGTLPTSRSGVILLSLKICL
jgi:hypothetical protein